MKVLLIGATGNLGLRLVPALLKHDHVVVAYIRSPQKIESLLSADIYEQLDIVQGDAIDSDKIAKTIDEKDCDGIVNTAGLAAMAPWSHTDLPEIFSAVLDGVQQASLKLGKRKILRLWMLGGFGVLNLPGTEHMLMS